MRLRRGSILCDSNELNFGRSFSVVVVASELGGRLAVGGRMAEDGVGEGAALLGGRLRAVGDSAEPM